ncbi:hypothetical protein [Nostoc piscinale]|uniref:hypothetical protein n=1 Tax=Nostoc piscinale TaxID=224012 RepID=UPI00118769B1|nr:hypothetical protein [Nostoc piscinale]
MPIPAQAIVSVCAGFLNFLEITKMTVKELIEKLQNLNPELKLAVDDISGGSYAFKGIRETETVVFLAFDSDDEDEE